jgi:predicted small secreted protein
MKILVSIILVLTCALLMGCGSYTFQAGASLQRSVYPSYGGIYRLTLDGGKELIRPNSVVQAPTSKGDIIIIYDTPSSTVGYTSSIQWFIAGTPVRLTSAPGCLKYGSPADGLKEIRLVVSWNDAVSGLFLRTDTYSFKVNSFRDTP